MKSLCNVIRRWYQRLPAELEKPQMADWHLHESRTGVKTPVRQKTDRYMQRIGSAACIQKSSLSSKNPLFPSLSTPLCRLSLSNTNTLPTPQTAVWRLWQGFPFNQNSKRRERRIKHKSILIMHANIWPITSRQKSCCSLKRYAVFQSSLGEGRAQTSWAACCSTFHTKTAQIIWVLRVTRWKAFLFFTALGRPTSSSLSGIKKK